MELTTSEKEKLNTILGGMTSGVSKFNIMESSCFHDDLTDTGFTALNLWKSYETPFYDGIEKKDSNFTPPYLDSYHGIV